MVKVADRVRPARAGVHLRHPRPSHADRIAARWAGLLGATAALVGGLGLLVRWTRVGRELMGAVGSPLTSTPGAWALLCCGLAMALQAISVGAPVLRWASRAAAVLVLLILLSTLVIEVGRNPLGIEALPEEWQRGGLDSALGGMLAAVTVLLGRGTREARGVSQVLSGIVLLSGLAALAAYAFGVAPLYAVWRLAAIPTSLPGALGLLLLGCAGLAMPPLTGPAAVLASPRMGGVAVRRFLIFFALLPVVAQVVERGYEAGHYTSITATVLSTLLTGAVCAVIVIWLGQRLNRIDSELEAARVAEARERTWLAAVLDQLPDAVLLVDELGRLGGFNRRARALLPGLKPGDALLDLEVLASAHAPAGLARPLAAALARSEVSVGLECAIAGPGGAVIPHVMSAAPIRNPDGRRGGAVLVLQDITRIKELERLREEWTAVVAHDLRQPVSLVSLAAQQLLRKQGAADAQTQLKLGLRIRTASDALARMVNDLLDASRIQARRLVVDPRELDLGEAVEQALRRLEDLTPSQPVRLERPREALPVLMDLQRLEQILGNLLSNAAKYGEPGETVQVDLSKRGEEVLLTVSNRGGGLDPAKLDQLFQRYSRAGRAQSSGPPGLGLGLYITRGLVEAHGGRIWAEVDGDQTCFHMAFPLAHARTTRDLPAAGSVIPSPGSPLLH